MIRFRSATSCDSELGHVGDVIATGTVAKRRRVRRLRGR